MNYLEQKKVACIGIGGGGVFYVAKFFLKLGTEVYGFDIKESAQTKELEALGARITYANPTEALENGTTLFVFSPGLPNKILEELEALNPGIEHMDVGIFSAGLFHNYEQGVLSEKEITAFNESDIAPLYRFHQSDMKFIGVTGTDGKTTSSTMIYHMLLKAGYKPGLVSTVSAKIGDKEIDTGFHTTTPSSQELFKLLKTMEDEGCTHAIIETTSHGLAMGRVSGLKYDIIAYTNITSDHLDYHKTWRSYYDSKELLITEHTKSQTPVILNKDDTRAYPLLKNVADKKQLPVISYSIHESSNADLIAKNIIQTPTISFTIQDVPVTIPIIGKYNVSNALVALAVTSTILGRNSKELAPLLADFETVIGRMQVLQSKPYTVIVDFAHTANALENALETMRSILVPGKKLIAVFGCAGKRDATKRVPMGEIAGRLADITVLTAEDPRSESLKDINDEVEKGWKQSTKEGAQLFRFDDDSLLVDVRRQAIEKALSLAGEGDIVIMMGKAHEQSLCFGTTEYPWSDITETQKLLNQPAFA